MKPASILERRLADHLIGLLGRMRAGCLVVPAAGTSWAAALAGGLCTGDSGPRRLACLDDRHTVAIARGHAAASGKVAVAVVGPHGAAGMDPDLALAARERTPLVVLLVGCPEVAPPGADTYIAGSGSDALALVAYAVARAGAVAMRPVCIHLGAALLEEPLQLHPHDHDLERTIGFAAGDTSAGLPDEIVQALVDAERTVLLVGRVSQDAGTRALLAAFAATLGASMVRDPLDPAQDLQAAPPAGSLATLINDAELVIGLDSARLAELLATATAPLRAMVIHVSAEPPRPLAGAAGHMVPAVDIHLRASPEAAIARLLGRLSDGGAGSPPATAFPRPVEIVCAGPARTDVLDGDAEIQPVAASGSETFVAAAVGAAAAIADAGRIPSLRLGAGDLIREIAALWTLQHAGIPATIPLDPARAVPGGVDIVALIRSFGIRVRTHEDDPGSCGRGPVVRVGQIAGDGPLDQ